MRSMRPPIPFTPLLLTTTFTTYTTLLFIYVYYVYYKKDNKKNKIEMGWSKNKHDEIYESMIQLIHV